MMDAATLSRPALKPVEWMCELLDGAEDYRIYDMCRQGHIPHVRIGRRIFFDPVRIEAWLAAGGTRGESA